MTPAPTLPPIPKAPTPKIPSGQLPPTNIVPVYIPPVGIRSFYVPDPSPENKSQRFILPHIVRQFFFSEKHSNTTIGIIPSPSRSNHDRSRTLQTNNENINFKINNNEDAYCTTSEENSSDSNHLIYNVDYRKRQKSKV